MALDPTVVLLIGAETGILDESQYTRTLTAVGNAARTTAQFKYGAAALTFDGTGDWVQAADGPDFLFGAGDFTAEGWFRFVTKVDTQYLMGQWDNGGTLSNCNWFLSITGGQLRFRGVAGAVSRDVLFSWVPTLNQWYHVAVDRSGTTVRMYIDGVVVATDAAFSATLNDCSHPFTLGAIGTTSTFPTLTFQGQMDEVRITKGLARYAGAFTPPTGPFPRPALEGTPRITQLVAETLSHPTPDARVTQAVLETLTSATALAPVVARVTQLVAETLTQNPPPLPAARVTQLVGETLTKVPPSPIRVSQAPVETVQAFDTSLAGARVTQSPLETVQQFAPSRVPVRVTQAPLEILYPFGCYPVGQCCHADYPRLPLDCRDGYPLLPPDGPDLYPILPAEDCMDASTFVVNMALAEIGITKTIASLSGDSSQEGDAARLVFSDVMDTVLRDHPWKFATEYAALLWDGGSPAAPVNPDWVYAYKLPDDCVRVRRVCDPSQQRRYSVTPIPFDQRATFDGDKDLLLCNEPGAGQLPPLAVGVPVTLTIEYTKRFTCPAQVNDAQFREAVVFKLAARLAKALARDSKDADRCLRNYTMALPKAQTQHANQSEPQRPVDDVPDWTKGR